MEFFIYLLKVSVLLTLFGVSYWLLLRKESFKNFNRKFLLLGLVLSFLLPGIQLKTKVFVEAESASKQEESALEESIDLADYEVTFTETPPVIEEESFEMPWKTLLFVLYFSGLIFMLFKLTKQILALHLVLQSAKKVKIDGITHYQTQNPINAFSFFNKVVYCPEALDKKALTNVLQHEQVHIEEKHSWDLLLANLAQVLLWFNPLVFWYRKLMDENLEFIADAKSVEQLNNKKDYQYTLLNFVQEEQQPALGNYFFKNSSIKTRIMMLNKQNSPHIYRFKSVVIIPILISFIALFQVETVAMQVVNEETQKDVKHKTSAVTHYSFSVTMDANTKNENLEKYASMFQEESVLLKFSKIKRNKKGEIKRIKIKMQSEDGSQIAEQTFSGNQPIPKLELAVSKSPLSKKNALELSIDKVIPLEKSETDEAYKQWNEARKSIEQVYMNGKKLDLNKQHLIKSFQFIELSNKIAYLEGELIESSNDNLLQVFTTDKIKADEDGTKRYYILKKSNDDDLQLMKVESKNSIETQKNKSTSATKENPKASKNNYNLSVKIEEKDEISPKDKSVIYIVNGDVISVDEFKAINPNQIDSLSVVKNPEVYTDDKNVRGVIVVTTKKQEAITMKDSIPWELLDQKEDLQGLMKYFNLLDDQIKSDFYNDLLQNKHSFSIYNNDDLLDEDALKKLDYKNILSIEKSENENTIFIKTKE